MRAELQGEIDRLRSRGITPGLAAVLVGDSPASATYVRMKGKACDEAGLYHETIRLKPETTEAELLELIERLNADHKIHGILVQLPLPKHIDGHRVSLPHPGHQVGHAAGGHSDRGHREARVRDRRDDQARSSGDRRGRESRAGSNDEKGLPAGGRRTVRGRETGGGGDHPRAGRGGADDHHHVALQHRSGSAPVGQSLDLFAGVSPEGAWTVTQVTRRARAVVEGGLLPLWVRGEISGFKAWQSGHWYFALRDRSAQIRCVMFQKDNRRLPAPPQDGMQVFLFARPTVWEEKGEFRLTVVDLLSTEAGGLWQLAFEKAKAALAKDGLLDPARKRALPRYPLRIAVVTSPDGAALRDIIAVTARRWPVAELLVLPTRVQGEGAEQEICAALALLCRVEGLDVAIIGRGGGSREDLWTFNHERVARAVAALPVPVISAVGHETDVTLCDLVADVRAPTPSAAAAAATPDRTDVLAELAHLGARLARGLAGRSGRVAERLDRTFDRLTGTLERRLERHRHELSGLAGRLDALSPLKILERGYALARDQQGRVLKRVVQFPSGLRFRLRVTDGEVAARAGES